MKCNYKLPNKALPFYPTKVNLYFSLHLIVNGSCFKFSEATTNAINAAKNISETGITGAYDEEFKQIEAGLAEIQEINKNVTITDDISDLLATIQ